MLDFLELWIIWHMAAHQGCITIYRYGAIMAIYGHITILPYMAMAIMEGKASKSIWPYMAIYGPYMAIFQKCYKLLLK